MVPAIILAAGRSSRMGRPKALLTLPSDGATFVGRLVRVLLAAGAADVLVVARPGDDGLETEVRRLAADGCAVRLVENAQADRGQLSSVVAGVNAADHPGVRGVIVTPVDSPLVRTATVREMLTVFETRQPPVVRASYRGRHGHPVIFSRRVFDNLRRADPAIGAKGVVHAHAGELIDIEFDDPGVVLDADNPDDYARMLDERG
jgi:CTP:molybdopterin cytidylyltransferase MocA